MMRRLQTALAMSACAAAALAHSATLWAQTPVSSAEASPGHYTLFHPAPRAHMRDMSTRDSATTIDAGHVQLELFAVDSVWDGGDNETAVGAVDLKLGLTSGVDGQVLVDPNHRIADADSSGSVSLRTNVNLWGNEGAATAMSVIPQLTLPTSSESFGAGYLEAALISPLELEGPAGWDFVTTLALNVVRAPESYSLDISETETAIHPLWGDLDGFVEVAGCVSLADAAELGVGFNSGLNWQLSDDLALDGGTRVGLNSAADDYSAFVGAFARY